MSKLHESEGILYRPALEELVPKDGSNLISFLSSCHPLAGMRVAFFPGTGSLGIACAVCHKPVVAVAVAISADTSALCEILMGKLKDCIDFVDAECRCEWYPDLSDPRRYAGYKRHSGHCAACKLKKKVIDG